MMWWPPKPIVFNAMPDETLILTVYIGLAVVLLLINSLNFDLQRFISRRAARIGLGLLALVAAYRLALYFFPYLIAWPSLLGLSEDFPAVEWAFGICVALALGAIIISAATFERARRRSLDLSQGPSNEARQVDSDLRLDAGSRVLEQQRSWPRLSPLGKVCIVSALLVVVSILGFGLLVWSIKGGATGATICYSVEGDVLTIKNTANGDETQKAELPPGASSSTTTIYDPKTMQPAFKIVYERGRGFVSVQTNNGKAVSACGGR